MAEPVIVRARYALLDGERLTPDVALRVEGGRITGVFTGSAPPETGTAVDCDRSVLLAAPVNAHTHLELSHLAGRVSPKGGFLRWAMRLQRKRSPFNRWRSVRGARAGLRRSRECGTGFVADICTLHDLAFTLGTSSLPGRAFLEVIEPRERRAAQRIAEIERRLELYRRRGLSSGRLGIAAHAPYSVSMSLARQLAQLAEKHDLPFSIHLAEIPEEEAFLKTGTGPIAALYRRFGLLDPGWKPPGLSPVRWAHEAGVLSPRTLAVHANYLSDEDVTILARSGATVVFCPRSHAFFGHPPHPVRALLDAGVPALLGTDSLASAPSLSILDEMRFLRRSRDDLTDAQILRMGLGRDAPTALGAARRGCLDTLSEAHIIALAVPETPPGRIAERLLREDLPMVFAMSGGRVVRPCDAKVSP